MRIIHQIEYFQPVLGYQETFLARKHIDAGHEVFVVTSDRYLPYLYRDNAKPVMGNRIKGEGFFVESGIQTWRLKTIFEFPNLVWLAGLEKKIREINPDLVMVHAVTSVSAARIAAMKNRENGFKVIYDDHATAHNTLGKMRVLYPLFKKTFAKTIRKSADGLTAILPATKELMQEKYGFPGEEIAVIPLGADTDIFYYDEASREELRKIYRFSEKDIVFIYTGKIIPYRQVSVLVKAFALLSQTHRNIKLLFLGTGEPEYIDGLKAEIASNGIEDLVRWQNAVPNDLVFRYYSASDVSVWPYQASIGMREAMACELPIIIGKESLVTELVEGDNGYSFTEGDVTELAGKMEKLLDPVLRKKMGENSRKLVEERFNWRTISEQYLEMVK